MKRNLRSIPTSLTAATLLVCCAVAWSQEPTERLAPETNPAVRAAVELPRTEPSHYLRAILALADLRRPELAVPILKELQQLNLSEDQRAELVSEFGSHRMLQLARNDALAPDGGEFAESCMAAAAARYGLASTDESADRTAVESSDGETESRRLETLLATADAAALSGALADALKRNAAGEAAALAEALGRCEDASVLYASSPQPAPLADALVSPDRRVRFAALGAIMALDPASPFPGSSRVPQTLRYLATAAGQRRAVVAMSVADHATTIAGRLTGLGIAADAATRGGPAVRLAQQSADLEMLLVDVDIQSPGIRDVLYALRTDPATEQIPIGLLATGGRLEAAKRLAAEHERVIAFPRPQSDEWLAHILNELSGLSARDRLSPDERAAMAEQARAWAVALGERNTKP
jgi:hypothetical protein